MESVFLPTQNSLKNFVVLFLGGWGEERERLKQKTLSSHVVFLPLMESNCIKSCYATLNVPPAAEELGSMPGKDKIS